MSESREDSHLDRLDREIAEHRRTAAALQDSERRFRELVSLLPDIIYEIDTSGRLTFANDRAFEQFGYTREELDSGLSAFDMLAPEDRQRALENASRLLQGMIDIGHSEYTARRKDGTTFPILLHSTPISRAEKIVGVRGVIVDITNLKRAEEELRRSHDELEERVRQRTADLEKANQRLKGEIAERSLIASGLHESEERYRTLVENLDDVVYRLSADGIISFVSPQVRRYGYEPEDLISRHFSTVIHPADRELLARDLEESLQKVEGEIGGKSLEFRLLTKSGAVVWAEERGRLLQTPSGVAGILREVTERHRREAEMVALQKARRAVWEMRRTDDLQLFLAALRESLQLLEIPFENCGINVMEMGHHPPKLTTHCMNTEGIPGPSVPTSRIQELLDAWRANAVLYRRDLESKDPYGEHRDLLQVFRSPIRSVLDVPFSHGTLAINSTEPDAFSSDHIESMRKLAEVLSEAFRRIEDLRRLEHRNRRLVRTRDELERLVAEYAARHTPTKSESATQKPLDSFLPPDEKTQYLILLETLENELFDTWDDLFSAVDLVDIAVFAEHLKVLGRRFAYAPLTGLGDRLLTQSSSSELDRLPETLEEYPRLIDELRSLVSE